ncbi:MAG: DUF3592 domain-containing protein [Pseudomonadota bacterium]
MFEREIEKLRKDPQRNPSELQGLAVKSILSASPMFLVLFIGVFFLLPLVIGFASQIDVAAAARLKAEGTHTQAIVHSNEAVSSGSSCSRLYYEFKSAEGLTYSGDSAVKENSPSCDLEKGDTVTVSYLAEDPTVSDIESRLAGVAPSLGFFLTLPLVFLVFLFMFAPTLVPDIKRALGHRKLYKNGRWAEGELIFVKEGKASFSPGVTVPSSKLIFKFTSSNEQTIEAECEVRNRWLTNHLQPGQKVNVVYSNSKPNKAFIVEAYIR